MIPAAFEYHRPADISAALAVLQEHGDEARVLAGGHSLIPMMKLRMADIEHLVDLQDIGELKGITVEGRDVRIGAMTTQHELITSADIARVAPILHEAALQIADPQVRYMGTVGGNIANGDPGNDMPGLMQCLDATFHLIGPGGARTARAREYYEGAYMTDREEDEILSAITFVAPDGGYAYEKQKRKIGDYATAACAAIVKMEGGVCSGAAIAMTNLSDTPIFSDEAGAALVGTPCDAATIDAAVAAAKAAIDPAEDNRGPVEFKMHVAGTIIRRAIERAIGRA
ncbi:MAG: xanthine dehydrogenase family protein subunit M [Pseudomonadota bacterium]